MWSIPILALKHFCSTLVLLHFMDCSTIIYAKMSLQFEWIQNLNGFNPDFRVSIVIGTWISRPKITCQRCVIILTCIADIIVANFLSMILIYLTLMNTKNLKMKTSLRSLKMTGKNIHFHYYRRYRIPNIVSWFQPLHHL